MTKENGSVERRLAFLEKAYIEDRRRWDRNEEIMRGMLQVLKRQGDHIEKQGARLEKMEERLDIVVRMFLRKFEE